MNKSSDINKTNKAAIAALLLAVFSCVLGLFFYVVKSPQARSDAYKGLAIQALQEDNLTYAAAAAIAAVRIDPANAEAWNILSGILKQDGQLVAARQAATIVRRLQQNLAATEPVYAMPAELKLSLLAMDSPAEY